MRRFIDARDVLMCDTENAPLCDLLAYSMYQPTAEKIQERMASYQTPDAYVYACVETGVWLGLIVYRLCENVATVLDIAVRDDMRGQGVGTFLIDGLILTSRAAEVLAETDDDAVGFYKAYGFTVNDTKTVCDTTRYLCCFIPLEIKTITRENWQRVVSKSFRYTEKTYGNFHCVVGLITINEVTSPLKKTMFGNDIVLADKGYRWLQIAPADEPWWLTVMIDPADNIVQYYYDITDRNILDGENSRFYDLYLDVVVLPDGNAAILDHDELNVALKDSLITKAQHEKAITAAEELLQEVPPALDDLDEFLMTMYRNFFKDEAF